MLKFFRTYIPEIVYGAVDGTVTTFAVVAGSTGGQLSSSIIIILGLANLFADGTSMSISAYLAAKSEKGRMKKPFPIALWTLFSFIIVGSIPLIPYIFGINSFVISCLLTGGAFVLIGFFKGIISRSHPLFSAVQTLFLGTIAAIIAYGVGRLLRDFSLS